MKHGLWTSDFILEDGVVLVKKTGHRFAFDLKLGHDILTWSAFYLRAELWRLQRALSGHRRPTIAFLPDAPRPWYMIWAVIACAGARVVADPRDADILMQFEDATHTSSLDLPLLRHNQRLINFGCCDVSKSAVAQAFERAAGYALAVDPATYRGPIVDKSEINAAHDGCIVEGPFAPQPGRAYQRLIDNEIADGGLVEDLRTTVAGGEPVIVFRKRRPIARRFSNHNVSVDWVKPAEVFSAAELDLIRRFAREMQLDWGGVDVLRDRRDHRIYIVDANKTDLGPPVAMKLDQKLRATRLLARVFTTTFAP